MATMAMLSVMRYSCWDVKKIPRESGGQDMVIMPVLSVMVILGPVLSGMMLFPALRHHHIICRKCCSQITRELVFCHLLRIRKIVFWSASVDRNREKMMCS